MTAHLRAPLALALCACIACATEDGARWTGTITDSTPVAIVANPTEGQWTPEERWTLEEGLRIGTVEGDPDYQFGQIGWTDVDSRGRIHVLDTQARQIKVYSPDGQYVQTIGGPGGRPGQLGPGVMVDASGAIADTLHRFPSGGTFSFGGGAPEIEIYSAEPVWRLTDDLKLLYGVNSDYRLGVYGAGGALERVITKPFTRRPVTERDRTAVLRAIERAWRDAGVPASMMEQLRSRVTFGDFFPAFSSVLTGPEGTIWVQHIQSVAALSDEELESYNLVEQAGAPDWDVFDVEGRYLGVVSMPARFAPRTFHDDKVYGVWRDELDVQYVMVLRILGAI